MISGTDVDVRLPKGGSVISKVLMLRVTYFSTPVTQVYNSSNVYYGSDKQLAFTAREPIVRGVVMQNLALNTLQIMHLLCQYRYLCCMYNSWLRKQVVCVASYREHMFTGTPNTCRIAVKSLSWNTGLVIDGQLQFDFPYGTQVICQTLTQDALKTVYQEPR